MSQASTSGLLRLAIFAASLPLAVARSPTGSGLGVLRRSARGLPVHRGLRARREGRKSAGGPAVEPTGRRLAYTVVGDDSTSSASRRRQRPTFTVTNSVYHGSRSASSMPGWRGTTSSAVVLSIAASGSMTSAGTSWGGTTASCNIMRMADQRMPASAKASSPSRRAVRSSTRDVIRIGAASNTPRPGSSSKGAGWTYGFYEIRAKLLAPGALGRRSGCCRSTSSTGRTTERSTSWSKSARSRTSSTRRSTRSCSTIP